MKPPLESTRELVPTSVSANGPFSRFWLARATGGRVAMDDGSWALAVSLGHVRNAVVAFVAAEDPSGASLFLAADCLEVEGLFADLGVEPEPVDPSVDAGADRVGGLLAAWPRLATAALRVLDAVTLEPAWLDDAGSVREVLAEVVSAAAAAAVREQIEHDDPTLDDDLKTWFDPHCDLPKLMLLGSLTVRVAATGAPTAAANGGSVGNKRRP